MTTPTENNSKVKTHAGTVEVTPIKYDVNGDIINANDDRLIDVNEKSILPPQPPVSLEPEYTSGLIVDGTGNETSAHRKGE